MQRRRREVTADEVSLWRQATRDVVSPSGTPNVPARVSRSTPAAAEPEVVAPADQTAPVPAPAARHHHGPAALDSRTKRKLRRGLMASDARIDLHGHTQAAAYTALLSFLAHSRSRRLKCVLVITGQGRAGGGVLRNAVPRWLGEAGFARHVNGFCEAGPRDGGAGALYVLLKRPG